MSNKATGDHLFISYATEDAGFAEWLSVRLAAEGYKVWCDRTNLLGGESYPKDIDRAIKEGTFRLLALLSHASLGKPNPLKERTLALSIGRERKIDFLIPLNVDGLRGSELDWMTSDLTFIPFHDRWAAGFEQLLRKLKSIGAPRDTNGGRATVCNWFAARAEPATRKEIIRTNVLPVTELPGSLHKFSFRQRVRWTELEQRWPCFWLVNSPTVWAFSPPQEDMNAQVSDVATVPWQRVAEFDGLRMENIALAILRKAITIKCLKKGMRATNRGAAYFPEGLLPGNHLKFTGYSGKKTYVGVVGERTFRSGEQRERIRYHLAPDFRLSSAGLDQWGVKVSVHLHLTDAAGNPLEGAKVVARRKRIAKSWWNHEWLSRIMATVEWLSDSQPECEILHTKNGSFRFSSQPIILSAEQGIDESALRAPPVETDTVEIEDDADVGRAEYGANEEDAADE